MVLELWLRGTYHVKVGGRLEARTMVEPMAWPNHGGFKSNRHFRILIVHIISSFIAYLYGQPSIRMSLGAVKNNYGDEAVKIVQEILVLK